MLKIREWVNLKAYAQKDPLLEYKKETFQAFEEMNELINKDTVEKMMKVQVRHERQQEVSEEEQNEMLEAFRPQENQEMHEGRGAMMGQGGAEPEPQQQGGGGQDGRKLSRKQRRQMDKNKKKKKLF